MSLRICSQPECQSTAGCRCGMWPGEISRPVLVPLDGDYIMLPGKAWRIIPAKDWVDVLGGTADG